MKRSEINAAYRAALDCFERTHWALQPNARWDITDFTLGDFHRMGLVLVNLAEDPEYCEKLMYVRRGQMTPMHTHHRKKEDIICRWGRLAIELWQNRPTPRKDPGQFTVPVNARPRRLNDGEVLILEAGERVTLVPGIYHAFWSDSEECVIGEVSTANDDVNDNVFIDDRIGRFSSIEEDEPAQVRLVSEV